MTDAPLPRARLFRANGEVEDVSGKVVGLQEFYDSWQHEVETPHLQQMTGWQQVDEDHPPHTGKPAYRVVYKTLKIIPFPSVEMKWPNLKVNFYCGDVERGGVKFEGAIPGRREDQGVVPEHGRLLQHGESGRTYLRCPNTNVHAAAWQETVKAVSALEIIWIAESVTLEQPRDLIEAGRTAVGPLLTQLEFEFGPRLLSTRITEEAGETFEDWHWNRLTFTGTVYTETQASLQHQDGSDFIERFQHLHAKYETLGAEERARLRLASRWYWIAQEETDPPSRFLQWWLVIESLEMPKTSDIKPAVAQLAMLLNCDASAIKGKVGRLFGMRSKLVHGEIRKIPDEWMEAAEVFARLLLAHRSGTSAQKERTAAKTFLNLQ